MNKTTESKRSAASWLMELAEGKRGEYALSVLAVRVIHPRLTSFRHQRL